MPLRLFLFLLLFLQQITYSQGNFQISSIPDGLAESADAVVRLDETEITISGRESMKVKKHRIVTVLNEKGLSDVKASEYFDNSTRVNDIEAIVYNTSGEQIKKIKRKDFKEVSETEGSVATDGKSLNLDYTPVQYPFTIEYTSEVSTSNTAFIPRWMPVHGLYAGIERSSITVTCNSGLGFKYKEYNFGKDIPLEKQESGSTITFSVSNIPPVKREEYSPSFDRIMPYVLFGLDKFHLEGVDGEAMSWENFGSWIYNNLLAGTDELPEETTNKIKELVGNETDPLKKAKIVYEYVQNKTRYISIQLGIGGWKPMRAKDVDRLGYGDCKALTNYTRALLKAVGVDSYYTIVYGDRYKRDIIKDFVSMQGNHVILAIPHNDDYVWLECTSQVLPFGFQGDFTDDRTALLVKPDKGELVHTGVYKLEGNTQISKGSYTVTDAGAITGSIRIASRGTQYDNKFFLEGRAQDELDKFYKSAFSHINNLKLKKTALTNDKDSKEFIEDIALEAESYCNKSGSRLIFAINAFNQYTDIPQRYRNRKNPFEILRGFHDTDEITINLPAGYTMEAKPDNVTVTDKFGEYRAEYITVNPGQVLYKRSLLVKEGYYESDEYENYRLFREKIARYDNAKIVLVKS